YSQNFFQKKFDMINMKIKQASYDTGHETEQKKSDIEIPGCDKSERNEILKMIYDRIPTKGTEYTPNYRYLLLEVMMYIVAPVIVFAGLSIFVFPMLKAYIALTVLYALVVFILLYFGFKHHRLYIDQEFIIKKRGAWDVTYEIIEPHKIQAITTKQYFWHRKADIGHLILHTAGGRIYFHYGNYTELHKMVNYWTYVTESSSKSWM
ncbi:MAG: PH domain-containing protein, partial [Pedobacter sp.]